MITEDYVSFETAKLLKEKGFKGECFAAYNGNGKLYDFDKEVDDNTPYWSDAPTLQMAMKWLREVHSIDIEIHAEVGMLGTKVYVPTINTYKTDSEGKLKQYKRGLYYKDDNGTIPALQYYKIYEEACEAGIKYCLENLI